jgi:signal transduction histidine kinase
MLASGRVRRGKASRKSRYCHDPGTREGTTSGAGPEERELERLAEEQAALRRVAILVAREPSESKVFGALAAEIGRLAGADEIRMLRFEGDGNVLVVGSAGTRDIFASGTRVQLTGDSASARVFATGEAIRIDDYSTATGPLADAVRAIGVRSVVGAPIIVDGRPWGAVMAARTGEPPMPPGTEQRLEQFTELIVTAIANAEARTEVQRLVDEQTALRRVATLVAQGVDPAELYATVTQEVARLFHDVEPSAVPSIIRFDPGPEFVLVGTSEPQYKLPLGSRWGPKELYVSTRVHRSGSSARVEERDLDALGGPDAELLREQRFLHQVGSPIVVERRLWGALTINSTNPLPPDIGARLKSFTDLVATAIANTEARLELERLAEEQAALRRAATLVAQGGAPGPVFNDVAAEMQRLLGADHVAVARYEPDTEVTIVAFRGATVHRLPPGTRVSHAGENVISVVRETERPARRDDYRDARGDVAEIARSMDVGAAVGAPIVLAGGVWGVIVASWDQSSSSPPDAEDRIAKFAELLETALANAATRDQLAASRVRLLTAADQARRRVVRDLHDGAQQRFVHSIVTLKLAKLALRAGEGEAETLVDEALALVQRGNAELRELVHGILPAALTHLGLGPAVDTLVARLDLLVGIDIPDRRFPPATEASAYFIIAESLTNVVKHARASEAAVTVTVDDGILNVEVRDDGVGGADPRGHGLLGLEDRATVLGGRFEVRSPPSGGTLVLASLPLPPE